MKWRWEVAKHLFAYFYATLELRHVPYSALYFSDAPPNMHGNHQTKGYDESLQQVHGQTTKGHPSKDK